MFHTLSQISCNDPQLRGLISTLLSSRATKLGRIGAVVVIQWSSLLMFPADGVMRWRNADDEGDAEIEHLV